MLRTLKRFINQQILTNELYKFGGVRLFCVDIFETVLYEFF